MNTVAVPPKSASVLSRALRSRERSAWRNFLLAMAVLSVAMAFALVSAAAAQRGQFGFAVVTTVVALGLAAWVAITIVPAMAKRTSLRWIAYQIDYRLTRDGIIYLVAVGVLVLAAVNTGNNLLYLVLSCALAGILISGVLSRIVLTGVSLKLDLPEHIFTGQPVLAALELRNEKHFWPSFSLRVIGQRAREAPLKTPDGSDPHILTSPVFFPYLGRGASVTQKVELRFARRGVYRQDAFGIRTRFPFGFFEKTRRVTSDVSITVYPRVEPTDQFYDVLPLLSGEIASSFRGRGHELHSLRRYLPTDSARFVDWKVSAKSGHLMVREFAREDERRLMLVVDPFVGTVPGSASTSAAAFAERFERAVSLAACIAWHFYELHSVLQFRTPTLSTPIAPAGEIIYDVLRELALIQPIGPPSTSDREATFLESLTSQTEIFKIIFTARPKRALSPALWSSSYFLFIDQL